MKKGVVCICVLVFFLCTLCCAEETKVHITSVQADFVQEKHMKMLVKPIRSTGIFAFQAPASLRWEYRIPVHSVLLMQGDQTKKIVELNGVMQEETTAAMSAMPFIMAEIAGWLDGRFADNEVFSVSHLSSTCIRLVPKKGKLEGFIEKIELQLADTDAILKAVTIYEGPDCFTTMRFSNQIVNKKMPVSLFTGL